MSHINHMRNEIKSEMREHKPRYLSEEDLERLIAGTESEPLMHPPKGFRDEIFEQIRIKKRRVKNRQMFSYSMKVVAATAAALSIVLTAPANLRNPEKTERTKIINTGEGGMAEGDGKTEAYRMSVGDGQSEQSGETWEPQSDGSYTFRLNTKMDEYCSQFNAKLNQLFGMEVYY